MQCKLTGHIRGPKIVITPPKLTNSNLKDGMFFHISRIQFEIADFHFLEGNQNTLNWLEHKK